MIKKIHTMTDLKREGKLSVGILATGTFLEYFDFMLYIHMGILLNELFFEATEPRTIALLSALGITITFFFRPVGAYLFGFIGDNFGRVPVLYLTTIMMAIACLVMAVVPTYAEIGITASFIMIGCRIIQSISSVGEITSCDLYLMETTAPPIQYPLSGITDICGALGGTFALGVASLTTMYEFNWRWAFLFGVFIAFIGFYARRALLETSEFSNIQVKISLIMNKFNVSYKEAKMVLLKETSNTCNGVIFALFVIQCVYPLYFYFCYIYCGDLFKTLFNYSVQEVIFHNFIMSIADMVQIIFVMFISYYVHPLKILKVQLFISATLVLALPYCLNNVSEPYHLTIIQYLMLIFAVHGLPAFSIFYKYISILKRFKAAGLQYSLGRAFMFAVTSFGSVYLTDWFGNWGLFGLFAVTLICYTIALFYFDKLEKQANISR